MKQKLGISFVGNALIDGNTLFSDLRLNIPAQEWTCLLGPSGVGKSTVLRLIADLDTAVEFNGVITSTDGEPLTNLVAYMAQSDLLLPWLSALQNVCIGSKLRGEKPDFTRAEKMLTRVGLKDHINKKPATLSGGQRQRVALARTLMEDRPIILLDEPFSALDAKTRSEMQELAAELLIGRTVLLVTHDPAEAARLAHSGYVMQQNQLIKMDMPVHPPVRAVDDSDTLKTQGMLFHVLREGFI